MINTITYSLEDVQTSYHPDRPTHPVLCDDCRDAREYTAGKRINWASFHALKNSPYNYQEVDYYRAGTLACTCCRSTRYSGRWLVLPIRKP